MAGLHLFSMNGSLGKGQNVITNVSAIHRAFYGSDPRVEAKIKERERQKFCPRFGAAMYSKKYIVPHYRQEHYYSQELANRLAASSILTPLQMPHRMDDVANAAL